MKIPRWSISNKNLIMRLFLIISTHCEKRAAKSLYTHLSFSISGPSYFVRLVSKMKRLLLPSISLLSKTTTKTMTNSMSLWLCTNNPTSLPLDPPSTIFFRIPQFPIEKSLSYTRVISYIHHDKNGGSCNFLAKKNKLPITRQQLSLNSN